MINTQSLKHPKTVTAIKRATLACIHGYYVEHVCNRQGIPFLAVRVRDGVASVTDYTGRDVTNYVRKVL